MVYVYAIMASNMSDTELLAEFKKRFIVPYVFQRKDVEEIVERKGYKLDAEKVSKVIENFEEGAWIDAEESMTAFVEDVFEE
jgi:hypothetical protein